MLHDGFQRGGLAAARGASQPGPQQRRLALLARRQEARAAKDFAEADRLRDELAARGWEVRDGPEGAELRPRR